MTITIPPGLPAGMRRAMGQQDMFPIALCSYGEDAAIPGWERLMWKAAGGYGSQGNGRGAENAHRETIDFSPHCLGRTRHDLFTLAGVEVV